MAKEKDELRTIRITRESFFMVCEDCLHEIITGYPLPIPYTAVIPRSAHDEIWERVNYIGIPNCIDTDAVLPYRKEIIDRLHRLGISYRVIDRRENESASKQMSMFDIKEGEDA